MQRVPTLRTGSPYSSAQLIGDPGSPPLTIIEVDLYNNADHFFRNTENKGPEPVGVDQKTVVIDPLMKDFPVNFRYATGERNLASILENMYVDIYAKQWSYLIGGGLYKCNEHDDCKAVVKSGLQTTMAMAGVPLYVENPNSRPTDRVLLTVTDSMGLFTPGSAIIPPLKAGQAVSVPVVLDENTWQFMDYAGGKCPSKNIVTISGELPCEVQQWRDKFFQTGAYYQTKGPDTFRVTFSTGSGANALTGLDAQSSGRPLKGLLVIDPEAVGGACNVSGTVRYPPGWQMTTPTRSVVPENVDNLFTGPPGQEGNPNGGMLRKK